METKKTYIAPQLTVVSFKAEQGYSLSAVSSMRLFQDASLDAINDDYNPNNQENWHEYNSGGDFFSW